MSVTPGNDNKKIADPQGTDREMLVELQQETLDYFLNEMHPVTGLIRDKTQPGTPASVAVSGLGISCFITAAENGYITRGDAIARILIILRFFNDSHQGPEYDATGHKGFYYHFLDMETGKRAWQCELSTIDTALLMAGILIARNYFDNDNKDEKEINALANNLYNRVNWQWAVNDGATLCHGWTPECGFLHTHWNTGYSEAHILYVLAMASPTYPIGEMGYKEWTSTFEWIKAYDIEYIYAGPLFIHQMSHIWIDFRGIKDDFCRQHNIDYFENSRRATQVQQKYAIDNPHGFKRYGKDFWGITASDGPGPEKCMIDGKEIEFFNYTARGVPYGPDDGTISPWAAVASLPFAPDIIMETIRNSIEVLELKKENDYGFDASFNPTYPKKNMNNIDGWVSPWQFGLNQGPVVLMIENYHTELVWNILKKCPHIINGMRKAGFSGGWLDEAK